MGLRVSYECTSARVNLQRPSLRQAFMMQPACTALNGPPHPAHPFRRAAGSARLQHISRELQATRLDHNNTHLTSRVPARHDGCNAVGPRFGDASLLGHWQRTPLPLTRQSLHALVIPVIRLAELSACSLQSLSARTEGQGGGGVSSRFRLRSALHSTQRDRLT